MPRSSKPDIPPLLPLEYCRIDRAARLLGCEVEDLYHWATERKIRLYVNFGFLGMGAVIPVSKDEPISYSSRHIVNSLASYSAFEPHPFQDENIQGEGDELHDDHGMINSVDALLFGLWVVHPKGIQEIYLGFDDVPHSWRWIVASAAEDGKMVVAQFEDEEYPDLWVMGGDLRKLHEHIHTGALLPTITNSKKNEPSGNSPGQTEKFESADIDEAILDIFVRGKQYTQEEQIITTLKAKGVLSKELPKNQPGKKGIKAVVKAELIKRKPSLFTGNSFDKAWERLLKDGRLAYL